MVSVVSQKTGRSLKTFKRLLIDRSISLQNSFVPLYVLHVAVEELNIVFGELPANHRSTFSSP